MKTCGSRITRLLTLVAAAVSMWEGQLWAQTLRTLYTFTAANGSIPSNPNTNIDGAYPTGLILSQGSLYGTTRAAGNWGSGTVFKLNSDGRGYTVLHTFNGGSDGCGPDGVVLSGNTLYGTESACGNGTVFAVNTDGTGFTTIHTFTGTNGEGLFPIGLVVSSNVLYGLTYGFLRGGGYGTVFGVNSDGTGFRTLYRFNGGADGTDPNCLVLSEDTLYGTARGFYAKEDGSSPATFLKSTGTVFKVRTDGSGFAILHTFSPPNSYLYSNIDGYFPTALIVSSKTVYGTTSSGGIWGNGTVFKHDIDGKGFTVLHSFSSVDGAGGPSGGLVLSGDTLYGMTAMFETGQSGTLFKVKTDGTAFQTFHNFSAGQYYPGGVWYTNSDGVSPSGILISGNTLYGTALTGGIWGSGTVFSIWFPPELTICTLGHNVILSWPSNYAGFDYSGYRSQSTTNLTSPIWTTDLQAPVVVNGFNTVTNPISGSQQFFRLSQ